MYVKRKYATAASIRFPLIIKDSADFVTSTPDFTTGDAQISKDGAAFANTTNKPTYIGNGICELSSTLTELTAANIAITIIDQGAIASKAWEDQSIIIDTYGNASAQHAFDLDTAIDIAGVESDLAVLTAQAADTRSDIAVADGNIDTILANYATSADIAATRSDIAALDIPSVQSDLSVITSQIADTRSDIAVVDGNIDTILANYATATDIADTRSDIAIVDGNVDTILANYATTADIAATRSDIAVVDGIVDILRLGIITGSAATGTLSTTQATTDLTGYTNGQLIGRIITVTSGDADGESSDITDYASASGLITFTAMTVAMANGDTFKIT